jgi:cell division protein FtsN
MARDYARKNRPSAPRPSAARRPAQQARTKPAPAAPGRHQHGSLSLKWIASLAAVGGFIGFIFYLHSLPTAPKPEPVPARIQAPEAKAVAPAQAQEKKPQFRFYEMLPESEVVPPDVQEYSPSPKAQDFQYLVQSGSFRSREDAERQRAQIAFQGLRASIQRIDLDNGSTWYRVNVGPFDSRSQMNSAIDKLVSLNIQPLIRKVPKNG